MLTQEASFIPEVDNSGNLILFHIFVDTFLLISEGAKLEGIDIGEDTIDEDFRKIITKKLKRNFISLLRSVTNTNNANLSKDIDSHLFDEDGKLYNTENYKKSIFGLLSEKNVKVSDFYEKKDGFLAIETNTEQDIAYFTFTMRFKYKLLDFTVKFEIGHNLYQDSNEYDLDDLKLFKDLDITGDVDVHQNLNVVGHAKFADNVIIGQNSNLGYLKVLGNLDVGNECKAYNVKIYGDDNDQYILWDNCSSSLTIMGELFIGGVDKQYDLKIFGSTIDHNLQWKSSDDKLQVNGITELCGNVFIKGNTCVGQEKSGHRVILYGNGENKNVMWDNVNNTLDIMATLQVGNSTTGQYVQFYGKDSQYCAWDNNFNRFHILGELMVGKNSQGGNAKFFGSSDNNYCLWDNSKNTLCVSGNIETITDHANGNVKFNGSTSDIYLNWSGCDNNLVNTGETILKGEVSILNNLTVGNDTTAYSIKFHGDTNTDYLLWENDKLLNTGETQFNDFVYFNTNLDVGSSENGYDVKVYGDHTGKYLEWQPSNDKLYISGDHHVKGDIIFSELEDHSNIFTIYCKTILNNQININGLLTVGSDECAFDVKVYGKDDNNYLLWDNAENQLNIYGKFNINNMVNVNSNNVSFSSNVIGKSLSWDILNGTFAVSGESTFNKNVNFAANIETSATSEVKLGGKDNDHNIIWCSDHLFINGDITTSNGDLKINGTDVDDYILWKEEGELYICGETTFMGDITISKKNDNTKSIEWDYNSGELNITSLVNVNNTMTFTGANLLLNGNTGGKHVLWDYMDDELKVFGDFSVTEDAKFEDNIFAKNVYINDGDFEITNSSGDQFVQLIYQEKKLIIGTDETRINNLFILDEDTAKFYNDSNINVTWTKDCGTLSSNAIIKLTQGSEEIKFENEIFDVCAPTHFKKTTTFTDGTSSAVWDISTGKFTFNCDVVHNNLVETNHTVKLIKDNDEYVEWDHEEGILTNFGKTRLRNAVSIFDTVSLKNADLSITHDDNCRILWDDSEDLLTINAKLKLKGDVEGHCAVVTLKSGDDYIKWDTKFHIHSETEVNGKIKFCGSDASTYAEWDDDKLYIKALTEIDGNLRVIGSNSSKYMLWSSSQNKLLVVGQSTFEDTVEINGGLNVDKDDVLFKGCVDGKYTLWDYDNNKLIVKGCTNLCDDTTIGVNNDNVDDKYVEWDDSKSRLTVSGSLVNKPITMSNVEGSTCLNFQTANMFHLTLCGNFCLENPSNCVPGQEGRIVILTNGTTRCIEYGTSWKFEDGNEPDISTTNTIDIITYYVINSNTIILKMDNNYC